MKPIDIAIEALTEVLQLTAATDGDFTPEIARTARKALADIRRAQYLEAQPPTAPDVLKNH